MSFRTCPRRGEVLLCIRVSGDGTERDRTSVCALLGAADEVAVAVHHPRHAVVVGDRVRGGSLQTALAHGGGITGRSNLPPSPDLPIDVLSLSIPEAAENTSISSKR